MLLGDLLEHVARLHRIRSAEFIIREPLGGEDDGLIDFGDGLLGAIDVGGGEIAREQGGVEAFFLAIPSASVPVAAGRSGDETAPPPPEGDGSARLVVGTGVAVTTTG
jgi:hypothetical protein